MLKRTQGLPASLTGGPSRNGTARRKTHDDHGALLGITGGSINVHGLFLRIPEEFRNVKLSLYRQFCKTIYNTSMKPLSLNVQTLYADLTQSITFSTTPPGSVFTQTIRGKPYLYAAEKHGATRITRYLGLAEDPETTERAQNIRRAAQDAKGRRTTVSMLKRAGLPAPTIAMGRLLEAIAKAGLFNNGVVLVGTGAYQTYPALVGAALSTAALTTQDADLAVTSLAVTTDIQGESLLDVIKRADPSFIPQPSLDGRAPPWRFRSTAGLEIEVVTRHRTRADEEHPVLIPGLLCSAQPLRYLEFLLADPVTAVALYGAGVPVTVPQPARYAVHKLIVAQLRRQESAKREKDLIQAKELIAALDTGYPGTVEDALKNARERGRKWKAAVDRSLREIGLDR
jgi:hypothetical protein